MHDGELAASGMRRDVRLEPRGLGSDAGLAIERVDAPTAIVERVVTSGPMPSPPRVHPHPVPVIEVAPCVGGIVIPVSRHWVGTLLGLAPGGVIAGEVCRAAVQVGEVASSKHKGTGKLRQ